MMLKKILIANPRGFCAGVDRAIEVVEKAIEMFGRPIYVRHAIVHNEHVLEDLKHKGAVFIENLAEVPSNAYVIFSAHGISPSVREEARQRSLKVIDATCPLVTKVHLEAIRYHKEGYHIFLIGHRGHQEVLGTMGEAPMTLVQTVQDVEHLDAKDLSSQKAVYLTQTTLSMDDTRDIIEALKRKFPSIQAPPKEDICYATQNRQNAVKGLASQCQLILVVGSQTSSNSKRLVETAGNNKVPSHLIPDKSALQMDWLANVSAVGITSGASVPDYLVRGVVDAIKANFPEVQEEVFMHKEEHVQFPLPKELMVPMG